VTDFDDLMAQMGVKKLDKGRKPETKKNLPRRSKNTTGKQPAVGMVRTKKPPQPTKRPTPGPTEAAAPAVNTETAKQTPVAKKVDAQEKSLAQELKWTQAEVVRLQSVSQQAEDERVALRAELEKTRLALMEAQQQLALSNSDAQTDNVTALGVKMAMKDHGVTGDLALDGFYQALAKERLSGEWSVLTHVADATSLRRFVDERLTLVCTECPPAPGRAVVPVGPERCEVCRGSDWKRAVRQFVDALLNHGWCKVAIVGGVVKQQLQLREMIKHRVLECAFIPAPIALGSGAVSNPVMRMGDAKRLDVIFLWGVAPSSVGMESETGAEPSGGPRLFLVKGEGITPMLENALTLIKGEGSV